MTILMTSTIMIILIILVSKIVVITLNIDFNSSWISFDN